tara:strand:+ start:2185 stop:2457 length:273 start_codon:yes stop_codon:yes gene_type:complete
MKFILLLTFFLSHMISAKESSAQFFEPNKANAYQGRLFFDPTKEGYPIAKMRKLCDGFTGIDTAQIKCREKDTNMTICEYKCSLHWSISD